MDSFLTKEEIEANRTVEKYGFGQVWTPPDYAEYVFKGFHTFPVKWANSSDRLYQLPYEDDLLTAIAKERASRVEEDALKKQGRKPNAEPWTYQDGRIFEAYLVRSSAKAFLIKLIGFGTTWVPKSQVDFHEPEIWLPEWFMKEKGLTFADAPASLNPPFEWEPALIPKKERRKRNG